METQEIRWPMNLYQKHIGYLMRQLKRNVEQYSKNRIFHYFKILLNEMSRSELKKFTGHLHKVDKANSSKDCKQKCLASEN